MSRRNRFTLACLILLGAPFAQTSAHASFHFARIDEFMVSYGGDSSVQFVEIRMETGGQNLVTSSRLNIFDANGNFVSTLLTVPSNVTSGAQRAWLMGTPQFETASGLQADFEFTAGIPTGGGMVCWGKPGANPTPVSCPATGVPYVDCVAYGTYSGPTNNCIGTPTPLTAEGHSLERGTDTRDNFSDFNCRDSAEPENNAVATVSMPATTPCSIVTTTSTSTTTATSTTTTSTTTTTLPPLLCGDATGDGSINATDALFILRSAVGLLTCSLACNVNGAGGVTATDALLLLRFVTGQPVELNCPSA